MDTTRRMRNAQGVGATDATGDGVGAGVPERSHSTGARIMAAVAIALLTVVVFSRTHQLGFINYDDDALLYRNPYVSTGLSARNVLWAFTSTDKLQWAPVTWLSHMIDFQMFGGDPSGHHVVSTAIHLINAVLVLAFLVKATGDFWRSVVVAALFALHPLHVEPVAWLSARKDLVSTALFLAALLCYLGYVRRPGVRGFLATIAVYTGSLMAKPMYVTMPFVLLLLDHWPLGRFGTDPSLGVDARRRAIGKLVLEKVPFAALSAVFSGVAYLTQARSDAVTPFRMDQLAMRASIVVVSYAHSLWKAIWPAKLAIVYPAPESLSTSRWMIPVLALAVISALVLRHADTRRYLVTGWLWFVIVLLPVTGIVKIGSALAADKFMYAPILGLFIMAAWGIPDVLGGWKERARGPVLATMALAVVGACAVRSWQYLGCWRDSKALYMEALAVTERNFVVMGNLGALYQAEGDVDSAIRLFRESVEAEPRFEIGHANLGFLLMMRNDCEHALPHFMAALHLRPGYHKAQGGFDYCRRQFEALGGK